MGFPGEKRAAAIATDLVAFHFPPFRHSEQIQVGLGVTLGAGWGAAGVRRGRSVLLLLDSLEQARLELVFLSFSPLCWVVVLFCGPRWWVGVRAASPASCA